MGKEKGPWLDSKSRVAPGARFQVQRGSRRWSRWYQVLHKAGRARAGTREEKQKKARGSGFASERVLFFYLLTASRVTGRSGAGRLQEL